MHATKETFVISVAAALLALALNQIWNRLLDASGLPVPAPRLNLWHLAAAFGVWLLVAIALFSSFVTNASGLLDSIRTYRPWLSRAGGVSEHIHPWNFYFHRLLWFHAAKGPVWTEALILILAVIGGGNSFLRKNLGHANASFGRFLALYTLFLTAAYTLIGYKTPWCLLSFWHGMILLAGLGAAALVRTSKQTGTRVAWTILLIAGVAHLGWQSVQTAIPFAADQRNPYAYAQTSPDVLNLTHELESLAYAHSAGRQMLVKVMAPENDYWPLPWYLRGFNQIGWWSNVPSDPYAPIIIISPRLQQPLDDTRAHLMGFYALRPNVRLALFIEPGLWQRWVSASANSKESTQ